MKHTSIPVLFHRTMVHFALALTFAVFAFIAYKCGSNHYLWGLAAFVSAIVGYKALNDLDIPSVRTIDIFTFGSLIAFISGSVSAARLTHTSPVSVEVCVAVAIVVTFAAFWSITTPALITAAILVNAISIHDTVRGIPEGLLFEVAFWMVATFAWLFSLWSGGKLTSKIGLPCSLVLFVFLLSFFASAERSRKQSNHSSANIRQAQAAR